MKRRWKACIGDALATVCALAIGLCIIFPVLYGLFGAFKSPAEFAAYPPTVLPQSFGYLTNFQDALLQMPLFRFLYNSLIVATMGSLVRLFLAVLAAYAFVFFAFRCKRFLFFFILATMMFPADTLIITNYLTVTRLKLLDSYLGMCITSFVGATQMFMLRQSFKALPQALREAALIDGCGDMRFLSRVLLPISRPVILTLFVQSFITQWNAYLWPLLVTNKNNMRTIQVGITMLTTLDGTNYSLILAGVALTLIPAFILFLFLRRNIVRGITAGALVG